MKLKVLSCLFFFLIVSHLSSKSQFLDTSILTQDKYPNINATSTEAAYKAPMSKLYGIWYTTNGKEYFIFNANGSGSMNTLSQEYNGIKIVWQQNFQWKKQDGQLMIRFVGEAKFTLAESDQPKYEKLTRSEKDTLLNHLSSLTPKTRNSNIISDKILFLDTDNIVLQDNYNKLWLINKNYIPKLKKEAQEAEEKRKKEAFYNQVFENPEQPAEFPGGNNALIQFLSENVKYPEAAQINEIQGRVLVQFIVEKDGSISNAKIKQGVDKNLDEEALRVVNMMPKFIPAKNDGVIVRSYLNLPVNFRLS